VVAGGTPTPKWWESNVNQTLETVAHEPSAHP